MTISLPAPTRIFLEVQTMRIHTHPYVPFCSGPPECLKVKWPMDRNGIACWLQAFTIYSLYKSVCQSDHVFVHAFSFHSRVLGLTLTDGLPSLAFHHRAFRNTLNHLVAVMASVAALYQVFLTCFLMNWHRFIYGYVSMAGKHPIVPACVFFPLPWKFLCSSPNMQANKQARNEAISQSIDQASKQQYAS